MCRIRGYGAAPGGGAGPAGSRGVGAQRFTHAFRGGALRLDGFGAGAQGAFGPGALRSGNGLDALLFRGELGLGRRDRRGGKDLRRGSGRAAEAAESDSAKGATGSFPPASTRWRAARAARLGETSFSWREESKDDSLVMRCSPLPAGNVVAVGRRRPTCSAF